MREKVTSFLWGYIPIPLAFYSVDMVCQITLVQEEIPRIILLTVLLTGLSGLLFYQILTKKRNPIRSPWALVVGAVLGLWHFFVPYLLIGSYGVWKTTPLDDLSFNGEDIRYLAYSFVDPTANLYLWQCDGSLAAVVFSALLFCGIVLKPKLGKLKK